MSMYVTYIYSLAVAWVDEPFFSGDKCQVTSSEKDSASLDGTRFWMVEIVCWHVCQTDSPQAELHSSMLENVEATPSTRLTMPQFGERQKWKCFIAERLSLSICIYIRIYIYSLSISIVFRFTCIYSSSYLCVYLHHVYLSAIFCDMFFPLTE